MLGPTSSNCQSFFLWSILVELSDGIGLLRAEGGGWVLDGIFDIIIDAGPLFHPFFLRMKPYISSRFCQTVTAPTGVM